MGGPRIGWSCVFVVDLEGGGVWCWVVVVDCRSV